MMTQMQFRIKAIYITPMLKPLGVNVPGSPTSTIPGSAPLHVETCMENPFSALTQEITTESLARLSVKALRELLECIQTVSEEKLAKSGKKIELIQRILASSHKEIAINLFLSDKDVSAQYKHEQIPLKMFASLRGGLRHAGAEILRALGQPYSVSALPEDTLPEGAHRIGDCPDPEQECLLCRVFGSLKRHSLFRNYTPPLVDDPDNKLELSQEVNHVLIRTHSRNSHRPSGNTLNFNQQYFSGVFTTYLSFIYGLPEPIELGFLVNCLEYCMEVGAAKAWGAGKLFLKSYTLEQVAVTHTREWTGDVIQLVRKETVTPLREELETAIATYTQWIAQSSTKAIEREDGVIPA